MIKLDYSLETAEERKKLVEEILANTPNPSERYLEILADYLVQPIEKQEKKERKILTDNRMTTINKREMSYEGLVEQFENGEDGIYNLITENKQTIFQPKISITKRDLEENEDLRNLRQVIVEWEAALKKAEGKEAYIIKKALIEMRKDQYIMKSSNRPVIQAKNLNRSPYFIPLDDKVWCPTGPAFQNRNTLYTGITFLDQEVCAYVLQNYSSLKQGSWDQFFLDSWAMMEDFDNLVTNAIAAGSIYDLILKAKIDGLSNMKIQELIKIELDIERSPEYISSLWCNKIPRMISEKAYEEFLEWYFTFKEKGVWKKCSRCGGIKLAHPHFFSKNSSSKDGLYSICKECRRKK